MERHSVRMTSWSRLYGPTWSWLVMLTCSIKAIHSGNLKSLSSTMGTQLCRSQQPQIIKGSTSRAIRCNQTATTPRFTSLSSSLSRSIPKAHARTSLRREFCPSRRNSWTAFQALSRITSSSIMLLPIRWTRLVRFRGRIVQGVLWSSQSKRLTRCSKILARKSAACRNQTC